MNAKIRAPNALLSGYCYDVLPALSQRDTEDVSVPVYMHPELEDILSSLFEDVLLPAPSIRIDAAYRSKAKAAHPDAGGNQVAMSELNRARDEALRARAA